MKSTCKKVEQTHWFHSENETTNRQSNLWQSLYQLTWGSRFTVVLNLERIISVFIVLVVFLILTADYEPACKSYYILNKVSNS